MNGDVAKRSKILLDVISYANHAALLLAKIKEMNTKYLTKNNIQQLKIITFVLHCIYDVSCKQRAEVIPVGYLLPAHDMYKKADIKKSGSHTKKRIWETMFKLEHVMKEYKCPTKKCIQWEKL